MYTSKNSGPHPTNFLVTLKISLIVYTDMRIAVGPKKNQPQLVRGSPPSQKHNFAVHDGEVTDTLQQEWNFRLSISLDNNFSAGINGW